MSEDVKTPQRRSRVSSEDARAHLINAVLEIVRTGPFDSLTSRAIASKANLVPQAIFRNFATLDDLYIEAARELIHRGVKEWSPEMLETGAPVLNEYLVDFTRFTTWMSLAKGITSVVGEAEHAVMRQAAAGLFSFDSTLPEQTKEAFLALNVFFGTGFMLLGPESLGSANPDPFSVFELMRYLHMHLVEATEWLGWSTRDVGKSDTTSPGSPEASPSS